ncbi:MAG: hypothetical protein GY941_26670, partial [Planctomycetes bacterium]|nr:hypothetical protein [Planctomycetota bacterium]
DPDFEENIKDLPKVAQDTYRNYANQSISLENGWFSYVLLKLKKNTQWNQQQIESFNLERIKTPTPYPMDLEAMLKQPRIFYPPRYTNEVNMAESIGKQLPDKPSLIDAHHNDSMGDQNSMVQNSYQSSYASSAVLQQSLLEIFSQELGLKAEEVENSDFREVGITSINAVKVLEKINIKFHLKLPTSVLFESGNFKELLKLVGEGLSKNNPLEKKHKSIPSNVSNQITNTMQIIKTPNGLNMNSKIAVIGISCRCSGAKDKEEFWKIVSQGTDCIQEIQNQGWLQFFRQHSSREIPKHYGRMSDLDSFDPLFFGISPHEAKSMSPSHRILLEEMYHAIEDTGYAPSSLKKQKVGTFVGAMGNGAYGDDFSHFSMLGSETSILSSRMAYFLDLQGPSLSINTACSSSLVAIDLACQQLKNRSIDLAIAGGITIYDHPGSFIAMNNAGMLSPTGECRPFDNRANGIVVGDGVGIVILKKLEEAIADHDPIYGVIVASGTNQDGKTSGITVPSFLSQSELESSLYHQSQINVEDIQYIETHGTGTKLGDPIEIHALNRSFQQFTNKSRFCAIGSLKANIGHTTAASGVLSIIKVLLSFQHQQIPPSINFQKENEHIKFEESPFYVNTSLKEWPENSQRSRLAAVSSFGFSGTNAHLVIEEAPPSLSEERPIVPISVTRDPLFIPLSAKNKARLRACVEQLYQFLQQEIGTKEDHEIQKLVKIQKYRIEDIAYTLQVARSVMDERVVFIVKDESDLLEKLQSFLENVESVNGCYRGSVKRKDENLEALLADEDMSQTIASWIMKKKYSKLMEFWVKGLVFDWNKLYGETKPKRVSLPTYPFARERYWIATAYVNQQDDTHYNNGKYDIQP